MATTEHPHPTPATTQPTDAEADDLIPFCDQAFGSRPRSDWLTIIAETWSDPMPGDDDVRKAALALMRRAEERGREHGAAEMRERAASMLDAWGDPGDEHAQATAIRAIPLTPDAASAGTEVKP